MLSLLCPDILRTQQYIVYYSNAAVIFQLFSQKLPKEWGPRREKAPSLVFHVKQSEGGKGGKLFWNANGQADGVVGLLLLTAGIDPGRAHHGKPSGHRVEKETDIL